MLPAQVLWPECGWQPISLTDIISAVAVKKAYRKATLSVHPDKVQQKGATVQQKYIAEKVFDLLKVLASWYCQAALVLLEGWEIADKYDCHVECRKRGISSTRRSCFEHRTAGVPRAKNSPFFVPSCACLVKE